MIANIRLKNFRSYHDESFEFSPGVNIIVGPNASGKTNLVEAILVLATGKSYRVKDDELVMFSKKWARIDLNLTNNTSRTVKLGLAETAAKKYEIDNKTYSRLSINHSLPVVLFEPNDLMLVSGGPERRRNYLDDLLEQTTVGYGKLRRDYRRTLSQRNALLKRGGHNLSTQLFPWDVRLSELAGQVVRSRSELVKKLQKDLPKLYRELSKTATKVSIDYGSQWPTENYESHLLKKLASSAQSDQQRGFTANGPHREDLVIKFNGHPAQEMASRGETRTVVLAMKIIELQIIAAARDITPILLLDDVFSELDGARRHALTEHLHDYQTFITTTDADIVIQHFTGHTNIIPLQKTKAERPGTE